MNGVVECCRTLHVVSTRFAPVLSRGRGNLPTACTPHGQIEGISGHSMHFEMAVQCTTREVIRS